MLSVIIQLNDAGYEWIWRWLKRWYRGGKKVSQILINFSQGRYIAFKIAKNYDIISGQPQADILQKITQGCLSAGKSTVRLLQ